MPLASSEIPKTNLALQRTATYLIVAGFLLFAVYMGGHNRFPELTLNHQVLESSAALIALFAGVLALVRYYSKRESKILIIAAGLVAAGLLDGIHLFTITSDPGGDHAVFCDTSRLMLAIVFALSWLDWRLKLSAHGLSQLAELRVFIYAAILAVGSQLLFSQVDQISPPDQRLTFLNLNMFFTGGLFTLVLLGYLIKGKWRERTMEHWIVLFLITNVAGFALFALPSEQSPDAQMQLAMQFKVISLLVLLAGLLISMYQAFLEAAQTTLEIAAANVSLRLEAEERRRAEKQITAARNQAEKSDKAKSEFLSSMSHELRTPLNSILGFGQLLESDPEIQIDGNRAESVAQIITAGRHLLELINEVLDLSRIETGNLELSLESVSVNDSLEMCLSLSEPMALQRDIRIRTDLTSSNGLYVRSDLTRFRQIMLNLMSNAIKYNTQGGGISITTLVANNEKAVRIVVSDTGPGLTPAEVEKIFEPFNRLAAANSQIEGTGIGLTITRQLVQMMDGSIGVYSTPGEGSDFWFELPLSEEPAPVIVPVIKHVSVGHSHRGAAYRILYIDDNPANIKLMDYAIESLSDMELITAVDAETGLEIARTEKPDIILLDIHMPGMDGYEALIELRKQPENKTTPVIAVTARATNNDFKMGEEAGFDGYITKPISFDAVFSEIDRLMTPKAP